MGFHYLEVCVAQWACFQQDVVAYSHLPHIVKVAGEIQHFHLFFRATHLRRNGAGQAADSAGVVLYIGVLRLHHVHHGPERLDQVLVNLVIQQYVFQV